MTILVFADSHGYNEGVYNAVDREHPDAVIHLGDFTSDADELEQQYGTLPVYRIRGNNDFDPEVPFRAVITPDNLPLYLTHGHKEHASLYSCGLVSECAREENCGFAFFGHTHRMMLEVVNGVTVCNPGSISLPRGGPPSYARLTIEAHQMRAIELLSEDGRLLRCKKYKSSGG